MARRFFSIWFQNLVTDWLALKRPQLAQIPFVMVRSDHGRMVVTSVSKLAEKEGIRKNMPLVDARFILPGIQVIDEQPDRASKLLKALAEWCTRYTPIATVDEPNGLLLDVTGCTHLFGGERSYCREIILRLKGSGYNVRGALADTVGAAWAIARFGTTSGLVESGTQRAAIYPLPPAALRLSAKTQEALNDLGIRRIEEFADLPKKALYRRFDKELVHQLEKALGLREEYLQAVEIPVPYHVRLPCLEPIVTANGIEYALQRLLEDLCKRLEKEGKGLRSAIFRCHRVDNQVLHLEIGTTRPSHKISHLFGLFKEKLSSIEPALGIELFTLDAATVEPAKAIQEMLWGGPAGLEDMQIAEWMDRVLDKLGPGSIQRFLPTEHHWPERSQKLATAISDQPDTTWTRRQSRPIRILPIPQPIQVTAPLPDYPPMSFRYQNKLHERRKASRAERIDREWWLEEVKHRDYYWFEDKSGRRYWIFRAGWHSTGEQWFLHGFFG